MDALTAYERRFRRAGLPLLIEDFSAYEDVFSRALPVLGLLFLTQTFNALNLEWSTAANVAAVLAGLAILLGGVALLNRRRGRSALAVPDRVGPPELAVFVLVPSVLPVVFGGQVLSALGTAVSNVLTLAVVYAVVGFGLLPITRWAAGRLLGQLAASLLLLARAVPLLLVFSLVLFVNTEMWQVFSDLSVGTLVAVAALFVAVGSVFMAGRLPREVRALEQDVGVEVPLRRAQRFNVGLVMFISQGLQVLVVSLLIGGFFVAFGALAITPDVVESWIGRPPDVVEGRVTAELLAVSSALAAFSGLYYAIALLTDAHYREEFLEELSASMRETFRARAEYLRLRGGAQPVRTARSA